MSNVFEQDYHVSKRDRQKLHKHNSFLIWFTGLSGSGKSTLANLVEFELHKLNVSTYTLDGDNIPFREMLTNHFINKSLKNPYGVVNGSDNAVHNGSNSSVPNNQGITLLLCERYILQIYLSNAAIYHVNLLDDNCTPFEHLYYRLVLSSCQT